MMFIIIIIIIIRKLGLTSLVLLFKHLKQFCFMLYKL